VMCGLATTARMTTVTLTRGRGIRTIQTFRAPVVCCFDEHQSCCAAVPLRGKVTISRVDREKMVARLYTGVSRIGYILEMQR